MKKKIVLSLTLLLLCLAGTLIGQMVAGEPYIMVWMQGERFPRLTKLGNGLSYNPNTGTIDVTTTQRIPSVQVTDRVFNSTEISLQTDYAQVAVPTSNGPVYLVHSQAHFYPKLSQPEFDAGGQGFVEDAQGRVSFRPYVGSGVVRVASIRLEMLPID